MCYVLRQPAESIEAEGDGHSAAKYTRLPDVTADEDDEEEEEEEKYEHDEDLLGENLEKKSSRDKLKNWPFLDDTKRGTRGTTINGVAATTLLNGGGHADVHVVSSLDGKETRKKTMTKKKKKKKNKDKVNGGDGEDDAPKTTFVKLGACVFVMTLSACILVLAKGLHRLVKGTPHDGGIGTDWYWPIATGFLLFTAISNVVLNRFLEDPKEDSPSAGQERQHASWGAIFRFCYPDWPLFLVAFTALSIAAAGQSAIPFLMGKLIDSIALEQDEEEFHRWMFILIVVTFVTGIFTGIRGYYDDDHR
eukprot:jgi/Bigna1/76927/fgenesh1_pg.44_\